MCSAVQLSVALPACSLRHTSVQERRAVMDGIPPFLFASSLLFDFFEVNI
jgi:hypothetical protein